MLLYTIEHIPSPKPPTVPHRFVAIFTDPHTRRIHTNRHGETEYRDKYCSSAGDGTGGRCAGFGVQYTRL